MTYFLLIVVEIDKKIKFHKVLGLEYMMKMKNYSNTEFLIKSWIMVIMGIVGFFVAFFQTIFNALITMEPGSMETKIVESVLHITKYICTILKVPAWLRFLTLLMWQTFAPALAAYSLKDFFINYFLESFNRIRTMIFLYKKKISLKVYHVLALIDWA